MNAHPTRAADVVIIGAGIAGTSTLLRLLRAHREGAPGTGGDLRVLVVERTEDVYAGLPYGARSGTSSLIVTPLREFLDADWLPGFVDWLTAHRAEILAATPLGISPAWVRDHAAAIEAGQWEDLFVPRRLFGHYLQDLVATQIRATPGAQVEVIEAEATSARPCEGGWEVAAQTAAGPIALRARAAVLAVGSPPKQLLAHELRDDAIGRYVADTHATSIDDLLVDLRAHLGSLAEGASRDVLVVGANADALELLHAVHRAGLPEAWDRRIVVLAPHGTPDAWTVRPSRGAEYRSRHLAAYAARTADEDLTAAAVHAAIAQDVAEAIAQGFSEQDTVADLKHRTGELLDRLPRCEQQSFVDTYGNLINRFSRPTGGDYQQVASMLLADGRIRVERATYLRAADGPAGWSVTVRTDAGERVLDGTFGAIVNCAGFEELDRTSDPLLRGLQRDGIVHVTPSRRGLAVDASFQAAPGLFVAGPLLAGNLNERMRVWHLESCHRIIGMSGDVADSVTRRLAVVPG